MAPTQATFPGASDAARLGLEPIDAWRWRLPRTGAMRVEGLVFSDARLLHEIDREAIQQVANVACLPGIVGRSLAMPDVHWGYAFAIGGVAAFDPEAGGVISPGGVGYDINCGVRLLRSDLPESAVRPAVAAVINQVMRDVPAGVGSHDRGAKMSEADVRAVLAQGARWVVERGWGTGDDLEHTEGGGRLQGADPASVGTRAIERGSDQLGTVGSGNHFIEIGWVDEVYDAAVAAAFGLVRGNVTVLVHSGSRGLGHQVCDDYVETMIRVAAREHIALPDRQLACAPLHTTEAQQCLGAMYAAANFAFANRQLMAHRVRAAFARVLGQPWEALGMRQVYDVAHNIAKWEQHEVNGAARRLCVHRKGATRAFPPGHPDVPAAYRDVGQPVLVPGDLARCSFVLVGTGRGLAESFGSCCHGAGRRMSRHRAKELSKGRDLRREFRAQGIEVRASSYATIAEEVPEAYKDVSEVVEVVHGAGIGRKVARLRPMAVLKG